MTTRSTRLSFLAWAALISLVGACTTDTTATGLACPDGAVCAPSAVDGSAPPLPPTSGPASGDGGLAASSDAALANGGNGNDLPCDVATVLAGGCASCHGPTPQFGAPMALAQRSDFLATAPITSTSRVAEAVLARVKDDKRPMPPAPHARLDAAAVATLEGWFAAGLPARSGGCGGPGSDGGAGTGSGGSVVPKPADCQSTYELKAHGATLDQPFGIATSPVDQGNQYHCFYFDPPYSAGSGMLWFESILDNTKNLHHWILYATDKKTHASGTSAACNAAQPGAYFVAGWAPGANNVVVPSDTSLELPSGPSAGLILELHYYNDTGAAATDASGLRFCTAPKAARTNVAAVHSTGSEGICVDPGATKEVVGTCSPRTDMGDIHIIGVWPHMHKIARHQKLVVLRAGGASEVIHDAPFDFNAQIFYPKDVTLHAGDKLETHCYYENDTSQRVTYGENTQEEMCYAFVMAWPAGALANTPSAFDLSSASYPLNRCANNASILEACNGINDAPVTIQN
jgi:Copper type II ascorbate-dependent monooxygenase, C-terminal domain/Copper type II ascorbate-dependent monooxygenase, N-terminal domain